MIRVVKRYESRKLYDTEESRYVSLDEIAVWVRDGQEVQIIDNRSSQDVTAQTLAQIILEEGRNGRSSIPADVLRDLVRFGERTLTTGVEHAPDAGERRAQLGALGGDHQVAGHGDLQSFLAAQGQAGHRFIPEVIQLKSDPEPEEPVLGPVAEESVGETDTEKKDELE